MRTQPNPARYILEKGNQTLYNGSSQIESMRIAKELGFSVIPGRPECQDCLRETVKVLGKPDQHYFYFRK